MPERSRPESLDTHEQWLASAAHLPKQAFRQISHPHGRSFLGIPLQTRETWEMYATYYDAMIHAAEAGQGSLPKLHRTLRYHTPKASWKVSSTHTPSNRTGIPSTINCGKPMPDYDSPHCRSSCGAQAHKPPCQIDSRMSARPTTTHLADYPCCGARRKRRSIVWEKTDTMTVATRASISACLQLSPSHPDLKNCSQLLQPTALSVTSPSRQ